MSPLPALRPPLLKVLAVLSLTCTPFAAAFSVTGAWPSGNQPFYFELDSSAEKPALPVGGLADGAANWNAVGLSAIAKWNAYAVRTKITPVTDVVTPDRGNGRNEVLFSSTIFGDAFGDRVLGVTLRSYSSSPSTVQISESDVCINTGRTWDSYRGPLREGPVDLQRVMIHELGHALGIDHSDEGPNATTAPSVMRTFVTDTDALTEDDIGAIEALYKNPITLPSITTQPGDKTLNVGGSASLSFQTDGGNPPAPSAIVRYSWLFTPPGGSEEWLFNETQPSLNRGTAQTYDSGTYQVRIETPDGYVNSTPSQVTVNEVTQGASTHLYNLSTRGFASPGGDAMFVGFALRGSGTHRLLIRGIGPTLEAFTVANPIQDPKLELRDGANVLVASNNNWGDTDAAALSQAFIDAGAFGLPGGSLDSAILIDLPSGNYTATLSPSGDTAAGNALVEAYDLSPSITPQDRLINLSTRGHVYAGSFIMIGGLAVRGTLPRTYLVRVAGGSLIPFEVTHTLDDPTLKLFNSAGTLQRENNDWDSPAFLQGTLVAMTASVGGFALSDRAESVMLVTLNPGNYSFHVAGSHSEDGNALFEIYEAPLPL